MIVKSYYVRLKFYNPSISGVGTLLVKADSEEEMKKKVKSFIKNIGDSDYEIEGSIETYTNPDITVERSYTCHVVKY